MTGGVCETVCAMYTMAMCAMRTGGNRAAGERCVRRGQKINKIDNRKISNANAGDFAVRNRNPHGKKRAAALISAFAAFALFFISCVKKLPAQNLTLNRADGSTVRVRAETARTDAERSRGFMKRKRIPDGTGMLFVFAKDEKLSFWMKDTPHSLSIAYIDSSGRIRDIYDMTPFSLAPVVSTVSVRYALEVPQGWFERVNVKIGDRLTLDFDTKAQ